jgi:RsiW-degrading membrane proteinase PrsW (M82 family)
MMPPGGHGPPGGGGGHGQPPGGWGPPGGGYGHPQQQQQQQQGGYGQPGHGHYPQTGPGPSGYGLPPGYGHAAPQYAAPGHGMAVPYAVDPPSPDRRRRIVGLWLWIIGILTGIALNILFTMAEVFLSRDPGATFWAMCVGALLAFPPLVVYLFVPAVIDRYDPEPWWCLLMAFLWGAIVATGFAGMINTFFHIITAEMLGKAAGNFLTPVVSAPLSEEFWKGLCVLGFFYFMRREFDGVVDGIIYATFCALGFAAVENVSYYARASIASDTALAGTFFVRGVLAPWGHPLYTSMIGIGFGIARETSSTALRWLAPIVGFLAACTLHGTWNLVATALGELFFLSLLLWFLFVTAFFIMIVVLVVRKGRTIRDNLKDEVLLGNMSQEELDLVSSPVGRLKATFSWRGSKGREFIRAAARLGLSKWHTARAMKGQKRTISVDFIVPLRREMARLRNEMMARAPR